MAVAARKNDSFGEMMTELPKNMVLLTSEYYEELLAALEQIDAENFEIADDIDDETIAILRQAEVDIANGIRGEDADIVFARLDKKHGFNRI